MSDAKQLKPPVTKNQSLTEILNEIESRAKRGRSVQGGHLIGRDSAKLVKALRKQRAFILWTAGKAISTTSVRIVEEEVAAILTSPENGEQQEAEI